MTAIFSTSPPSNQDFVISALPNHIGISQGTSSTSGITIASVDGFASGVVLSVKSVSGITANLSNTQVAVSSGGSGQSTLTFSVAPTLASGFYSITVVGKSGTITHSIKLSLSVATSSASSLAASACKNINGEWSSASYACQINSGAAINFLLRIPAGVTFNVNTDASLAVTGAGRIVNDGVLNNYWYLSSTNTTSIKNDARGIINNYGTISAEGNTTNYGKINIDYGSSLSNNFATIYNAQGGVINVSLGSSLYNNGHLRNAGTVNNAGYIAEYCSSTFTGNPVKGAPITNLC